MAKTRILFIIRKLELGGAERQLIELVRSISSTHFEVAIVTFYDSEYLSNMIKNFSGVRMYSLHKRTRLDLLRPWIRICQFAREFRPHIIHGYMQSGNILAFLVRMFLSKNSKVVFGLRSSHSHLEMHSWGLRLITWCERLLAPFADLAIANSASGAQYAIENGFLPHKMEVIPNGVNLEEFFIQEQWRNEIREKLGVGREDTLIGIVGRADPKKGHALFFEAALLSAEKPNWKFLVAGLQKEVLPENIQDLIGNLSATNRLLWLERTSEIAKVYNALDILSFCSNEAEGFPNVILESMACGTPCVVTQSGAAAEIVGVHGIVLEERIPEALFHAWDEVSLHQERYPRSLLRESVATRFSSYALGQKTAHVLLTHFPQLAQETNA